MQYSIFFKGWQEDDGGLKFPRMNSLVKKISTAMNARGGRTYLVGGSVRDQILGLPVKDYDLEIFGLPSEQIQTIAQQFGRVEEVGKAFGILKLWIDGQVIDLAAPRQEKKTGPGHRGFDVTVDPTLTPEQAARRRDFTVNAIMQDPLTDELIDPFHGRDDLEKNILRVVDPQTFVEDPLRVLRAFQMAARFTLTANPATKKLLQTMLPSVRELPPDRIREEWIKLFLKAPRPSIGLALAFEIGYFEPFSDFVKMKTTIQGAETHPEGDVWTHTLMAVDKVPMIAERDQLTDETRLLSGLAVLCHDTGKPSTLQLEGGAVQVHGHAQAGVRPSYEFLMSQGFSENLIEPILSLVRHHMDLHELYESDKRAPITDGAIRRLLNRLKPATIQQLLTVGEADFLGRGPWKDSRGHDVWPRRYPRKEWFLDRLERSQLEDSPPPIIQGRDLMALGWKPGPDFGPVIAAAETYAENTSASKEEIIALIQSAGSPAETLKKLAV